jgi:hypothetical protein
MVSLIDGPSRVEAAGTPPKLNDEDVGQVNADDERLTSPAGWVEPGQRPAFALDAARRDPS